METSVEDRRVFGYTEDWKYESYVRFAGKHVVPQDGGPGARQLHHMRDHHDGK